jgi:hypothetical protein
MICGPSSGGARLRVVVRDDADPPIVGAVVMIVTSPGEHSDIAAVTDDHGMVRFAGLDAGDHVVAARTDRGGSVASVEVLPGEEVFITLRTDASPRHDA